MLNKKGFTLTELLVMIGIIALIAVFAAIAVNAARSTQRDATRLSNVRMLQSALEDFFNEYNTYPTGELLPLGDARQSACLGEQGFAAECQSGSTFLSIVSGTYEDGLDGIVTCGDPARRAICYQQTDDGENYIMYFELENALEELSLQSGVNCATPNGMEAGVCSE